MKNLTNKNFKKGIAGLVLGALLFSLLPAQHVVLAEEGTGTTTPPVIVDDTPAVTSTSTDTGADDAVASSTGGTGSETASTTASSTVSVTGDAGIDGADGATTTDAGTGTSTDEAATSTDAGTGTEGSDGGSGDGGGGGDEPSEPSESLDATATSSDELSYDPIPYVADGLIGDDTPEDHEVTGAQSRTSNRDITIDTGNARAQGEIYNDANSTNVRSVYVPAEVTDLDFYTFNATGTNEATVTNDAAALALTGENDAYTYGEVDITTGDAVAVFNIANVVNSSIVNSDGYLYLANQILEPNTSLDLQDFFFPGGASALADASNCSLLSCVAEDIEYNFSQTSQAVITNDAYLEAVSGDNWIERSDRGDVTTGNAYGSANVVNVVNTNIIDSNYRLLTFNAIGDLDGDLILPTEELFDLFFGLPNGTNQLEDAEDLGVNVDNTNEAEINNNVETYAESGLNDITSIGGDTVTGRSESESNILNKVNENIYGGDNMYLWIRVHGGWSGDVVGLPDGLTWQWTPDGVIIYNENAEIEPSAFLGFDIDSYNANFTNNNDVVINNNINVDAVTGKNLVESDLIGNITTGEAYASANVMNIANTNVIGTNWVMAVINIMGDFDGNVTFAQTDISLAGSMDSPDEPLMIGSDLVFSYTVSNTTDKVATNVLLRQALQNAHVPNSTATVQTLEIGDLDPGESATVNLFGEVSSTLPYGTSTVRGIATVESDEGDTNTADNAVVLTDVVYVQDPNATDTGADTGTTTDGSTGSTTDDGTGTTTDDGTGTEGTTTTTPTTSSGGGGGGGGGSSSKTKSVDREEQREIDPDAAPMLVVQKKSSVDEDDEVLAGSSVDYTIKVTNYGGTAYDAVIYDTLRNPISAILSEQSWELGTVLPGEEIMVEYTTTFDLDTPTGKYTNTASIEAYREEDGKEAGDDPLKLKAAVHKLELVGVPLAVGNVQMIAYFPGPGGKTAALMTWETSQPARAHVLYSPSYLNPVYREGMLNGSFQSKSVQFPDLKTKHFMILMNLAPGTQYTYQVHAKAEDFKTYGGDYTFTVPAYVDRLTLAFPKPGAQVAGASSSAPATPTAAALPTPVAQAPAPRITAPAPEPEPIPEPTTPIPAPEPEPEQKTGFFGKVVNFFR